MKKLPKNWKKKKGMPLLCLYAVAGSELEIRVEHMRIETGRNITPADGCDFIAAGCSRSSKHVLEDPDGSVSVSSLPAHPVIKAFVYCRPDNEAEAMVTLLRTIQGHAVLKRIAAQESVKLYEVMEAQLVEQLESGLCQTK